MFRTGLIVVTVALALVTVAGLTAQSGIGKPAVASSNTHSHDSPAALPRPQGYAAMKEAQLEQVDAAQSVGGSTVVTGGEDDYVAIKKEQRAAMKSAARDFAVATARVPRKDYAAMKEAQLEQQDAAQFDTTLPARTYGIVARDSIDELRYQRLLRLNGTSYPSPASVPTFWSGQPY